MAGTSEGAKKANEQRSPEDRSEASRKAAETRKERDPEAFQKMGEKGGSQSQGGTGQSQGGATQRKQKDQE